MGRCRRGFALGRALTFLLLVSLFPVRTLAGDETAGTRGAAFLRIPIGARAMAGPDNVAAARGDASALFASPAFMAGIVYPQAFLTGANWLEDLSLGAGSIVLPFRALGITSGAGVRILRSGTLQGFDANGDVVASDHFYDLAASAGLAKRFTGIGIDLGASTTYIREHLPTENGEAFTVSLGAAIVRRQHRIDLFALDLGGELAFDGHAYPIERRYGVGYARHIGLVGNGLDLGTQLVFAGSDYRRLQFGGTYDIGELVSVRAGYDQVLAGAEDTRAPVSAGLGVHHGRLSIDYAYATQEFFPSTHTFSVTINLGAPSSARSHVGPPGAEKTAPATPPGHTRDARAAGPSSAAEEGTGYRLVGNVHGRLESARAEVRALRLLKIPAVPERVGERYRILIGRYGSRKEANAARDYYAAHGHQFEVIGP